MALMTFNADAAEKAKSGGGFESGAHVGIMQVQHIIAQTNTKGFQLNLHGDSVDVNFINLYYEKVDGTAIKSGTGFINAIMGLTRTREINIQTINDPDNKGDVIEIIPELMNKSIGMVLQKVNYVNGQGGISYKVELVMVFDAQTRQTYEEKKYNKQAATVDKICSTLTDRDEAGVEQIRNGQNAQAVDYSQTTGRPQTKFDQIGTGNGTAGGFVPQQGQQQGQQAQANDKDLDMTDDEFFS